MPLGFLLDEHLRGPLWTMIQRHNLSSDLQLDIVRVGDVADLPLGTLDGELLLWAEHENRILVTEDKRTMPRHLAEHLASGHHSPGVFVVRAGFSWGDVLDALVLVAHTGDPADYLDVVTFLP